MEQGREIVPLIKRGKPYYLSDGSRTVTVPRRLHFRYFVPGILLCAFTAFALIMDGLRTDQAIAEWWTVNIARWYERAVGAVTSVLPVSAFEICVIMLVFTALYLLVRLEGWLCSGKLRTAAFGLAGAGAAVMYVFDLYLMSMGFGYYRAAMPLAAAGSDYTLEQTVAAVQYFLSDYNALASSFDRDELGNVISPYTFSELNLKLGEEYAKLGDYFFGYTPTGKAVANSWFMSAVNITGITFLPTGEANLNVAAPPTYSVFTLAHELAHTKGVQREGDANLIAEYVLLASDDDYLRYCGYYESFSHFASAISLAGGDSEYSAVVSAISREVRTEKRHQSEYWRGQPNIPRKIGDMFNDLYLMFNGADNGMGSYSDGEESSSVTPVDPDTGEPETDPDTGKPVIIPYYSQSQMIYFYLYEKKTAASA